MAAITASMVSELRGKTDAPMMECKKALTEADGDMAKAFFAALDRTYELYLETGRKLMVANFANILIGILAPTARRLMCDISPCGGGRAFFALAADGSLYPCSEFIGLPRGPLPRRFPLQFEFLQQFLDDLLGTNAA